MRRDRHEAPRPYRPISDYAVIGDCRTAALVSRRGSIDWLCLPRFDAPSVFNSLLDHWRGGRFCVTPEGCFETERHYVPQTNVLVTEFRCASGRARLTDWMPALSEEETRRLWLPDFSLLRLVEGLEGELSLRVLFKPRPFDGQVVPRMFRAGPVGCRCELGDRLFYLGSSAPLEVTSGEASATWTLRAGQSRALWLAYSESGPAVYPVLGQARDLLERTIDYWKRWSASCAYRGPHRERVLRSALTLKLLSFAPSGAIVAAPTTSLPEALGGPRNWDYRFCWLRDASYAAQCFFRLGFVAEACSFVNWMRYATTRTHPVLKVFYDLYGEHVRKERPVPWLEGYGHSRPVRRGNGASSQYQLDVYGGVMHALLLYAEQGCGIDRDFLSLVAGLGEYVASHWSLPDHGIWEVRGERRHYVHSKVMCWAALLRAERLGSRLRLPADYARWYGARKAIEEAVVASAWSPAKRSFVQSFGAPDLDATSLFLPVVGFLDPCDPRAAATVEAVRRELGCGSGDLLYRYRMDDGLPGREGAFLACGFWLSEALFALGREAQAEAVFERAQARANDVGLFSEELDAATGEALGNFPLALTHVSHVLAALMLHEGRGRYQMAAASWAAQPS